MERLTKMIAAAEAKLNDKSYHGPATAEDGIFQVYLTLVEQRTVVRKAHYRVGYYMLADGDWKRTSKGVFLAEMGKRI